jgi:N-acetylglutamate synthase-like GNAT family acetyltransferase
LLVADGRSLKEISKGLAHQNKLSEKAKRVAREEEVSSCFGCGNSGDLKCNDCGQTWCSDCSKGDRHQGEEQDIDGKWLCQFCDSMKEVKIVQNAEELTEKDERGRPIRLLQAPVSVGGCAICKKWNLSKSGFVDGMTMLVCDQCGREYHVSCLKDKGVHDLNELPEGEWFCQKDCKVIDEILAQLVANGPESLSDSIISQLLESRQQQIGGEGNAESSSPSFGWQILCGRGCDSANVQTLGEAANIFAECSDPIRDAKSGRNLLPSMVHSRRSKEYDFEGVFCVVLKRNDKVVSAALLQIFGREIAEVPLVATSLPHQGQGFCRALLTTIERLLGVLSVGRLVLPTSEDTELIWINKFGFSRMTDEQLMTICTTIRLMTFTGTCMLGKPIIPMTV